MTTTTAPALTTTFSPAASCLTDDYLYPYTKLVCLVGTATTQCIFNSLGPPSTSACFPSGYKTASTAYFSPGICPSGYAQACSSILNIGTVSETRATCCPSGYLCQTGTDWPWYSDHPCTSAGQSLETWVYTSSTDSGWYIGTTTAIKGMNAYGVSIRYQASDFTTPSATSTSTSTSTSTTQATTGQTAAPPASQTAGNTASPAASTSSASSLSTGAKAGIGVGCAAAVILFILAGFLFLRSRKRKAAQIHNANSAQTAIFRRQEAPSELPSSDRSELGGSSGVVYQGGLLHELPGEGRGNPL